MCSRFHCYKSEIYKSDEEETLKNFMAEDSNTLPKGSQMVSNYTGLTTGQKCFLSEIMLTP